MEEDITDEELKNKAAQMNVSEGRGDDWIPFNEYLKGDEAVRAAVVAERQKTKGGIVGSETTPAKQAKPKKDYSKLLGIKPASAAEAKPGIVDSAMKRGDALKTKAVAPAPVAKQVSFGGKSKSTKFSRKGHAVQVRDDNELETQINSVKGKTSGGDKNRMRIYENRAADRVRESLKDGNEITSRSILEAALKSRDLTTKEDNQVKAILNK
jgi:hypothetical protein